MKIFYALIVILGFASCHADGQQSKKISGVLLMSPWRTDESFDVFLPCNIDSSISLQDNLRRIKTDTAYQTFSSGDFAFDKQVFKLRNQAFDSSFADYLKYCLVLPITAVYDTAAERLFKNIEKSETLRMTYKFFDKTVSEYYSTKQAYLKNITVIFLSNKKNGN
jgi:hypothetical protein